MAYHPHGLLRFGGAWFVSEIWSCGLRIITDDSAATTQQWVDALEPNEPGGIPTLLQEVDPMIREWFQRTQTSASVEAKLNWIEWNAIGPDGKYADPGNPHRLDIPSGETPSGASTIPTWPQLATVVTLRSAVERGRGTHGRIYVPTGVAAAANGRIGAGVAQNMADSAAQLFEEIATLQSLALAGEPRVGIVSAGDGPNAPAQGPSRIVTRVQVGNVMDTQRRRRNQLAEVYVESPVES